MTAILKRKKKLTEASSKPDLCYQLYFLIDNLAVSKLSRLLPTTKTCLSMFEVRDLATGILLNRDSSEVINDSNHDCWRLFAGIPDSACEGFAWSGIRLKLQLSARYSRVPSYIHQGHDENKRFYSRLCFCGNSHF